jgi:hypothetical protein
MRTYVAGWRSGNAPDAHSLDACAVNDFKTISHRIEQERNLATANRV